MSDWQQMLPKVQEIRDFFRPLVLLDEVPRVVQAANVEIVRLRAVIKHRETAIADLDKVIAGKKAELKQIEDRYNKEWREKEAIITKEIARRQAEAGEKLSEVQKQINAANSQLKGLNKQLEELRATIELESQDYQQEKAAVGQEINERRANLKEINDTIGRLLSK